MPAAPQRPLCTLWPARLNGIALAVSLLQSGETALPVRLIIKDTASDEAQAVQAVRELADDGVAAIIGPIIAAPGAAREAQRLQMPMVTITQKSDVTETGNYIFRHFITPQNQVRTLVELLRERHRIDGICRHVSPGDLRQGLHESLLG